MTNRHLTRISILAASALLLGASCVQIKGSGNAAGDGGLFRSTDKGAGWTQKSAIASTGAPKSFGGVNVVSLTFDPSDARAMYAGTDGGLLYSYDGADSWNVVPALTGQRIAGVAVHYGNKCIIYAAAGNRVGRSADCSRTWTTVYTDTRPNAVVTDIVADHFNRTWLYAGNSAGDLLRSTDEGASWSTIHRFESPIRQVLMKSSDSRTLFIVTASKGIWRTTDGGGAWSDLTPKFGTFAGALDNVILAEDARTPDAYLASSNYGLLRTTNGGEDWTSIPLLTPTGSTIIYSLAVNPKNSSEIYYGTVNLLYRTVDGGTKWITTRPPTTRALTKLVVSPGDENTVFFGTTLIEKKSAF